ncbi:hypothetical protein HC776_03740 [bacterium]|nr:hypothetical protein [bacterium]
MANSLAPISRRPIKRLWDLLEEIHLQFRTDESALNKYSTAITQVNSFLIKNALYLDEQDQNLARTYLTSLKALTEIVNKYRDDVPQLAAGWDSTATFSTSMVQQFQQEEKAVVEALEGTRQQILDKCRRVLKSA